MSSIALWAAQAVVARAGTCRRDGNRVVASGAGRSTQVGPIGRGEARRGLQLVCASRVGPGERDGGRAAGKCDPGYRGHWRLEGLDAIVVDRDETAIDEALDPPFDIGI